MACVHLKSVFVALLILPVALCGYLVAPLDAEVRGLGDSSDVAVLDATENERAPHALPRSSSHVSASKNAERNDLAGKRVWSRPAAVTAGDGSLLVSSAANDIGAGPAVASRGHHEGVVKQRASVALPPPRAPPRRTA